QAPELFVGQPQRDEGAEHHEVALGEIDGFGRLVDEHEAQRDQAVYAAVRKAAHKELQYVQGRSPPNVVAVFAAFRSTIDGRALSTSRVHSLTNQGVRKTFPFGLASSSGTLPMASASGTIAVTSVDQRPSAKRF